MGQIGERGKDRRQVRRYEREKEMKIKRSEKVKRKLKGVMSYEKTDIEGNDE